MAILVRVKGSVRRDELGVQSSIKQLVLPERPESRSLARNPAKLAGARRVREPEEVVLCRIALSWPRTADRHTSPLPPYS